MIITDLQTEIIEHCETTLKAAGTPDLARLWIQRGVDLIVSRRKGKDRIQHLKNAHRLIEDCIRDG
jgi:predicted Fe-Mo cluster-binding NifX family protein